MGEQQKLEMSNKSYNSSLVKENDQSEKSTAVIHRKSKVNTNSNFNSLSYGNIMQLQSMIGNRAVTQLLKNTSSPKDEEQSSKTIQRKKNETGMPDNLKAGVENLSGMDMSEVRVHYNSDRPAQLNALAYAQGTDIHVAPGQERHLPHEAWHIVQQAQGRVKPTLQMKDGAYINNQNDLESEADRMGEIAIHQLKPQNTLMMKKTSNEPANLIQRVLHSGDDPVKGYTENPGEKSLFYGINTYREVTMDRLKRRENGIGAHRKATTAAEPSPYRTIDEYNKAVGINDTMMQFCAAGIFKVREALRDANAEDNWTNYFYSPDLERPGARRNDLRAWIRKLKASAYTIGLYDYGSQDKKGFFSDTEGVKKLKSKNRYTKNFDDSASDKTIDKEYSKVLSMKDISLWLGHEMSYEDAGELLANYPADKAEALSNWIYRAFFRRTSKLGADFIVEQNAKVYFNKAVVDRKSGQVDSNGVGNLSDRERSRPGDYRPITVSEYRHMQKRLASGQYAPDSVKFYSET